MITSSCKEKKVFNDYPKERSNAMELLAILDEFTNGNAWDTGANNQQINWLTAVRFGAGGSPEHIPSISTKKGQIHVTMGGEFSDFYLRKRSHPVPWSINMYGARTMYFDCMLQTDTTGGGDTPDLESYFENEDALVSKICYENQTEYINGTPNFVLYQLKLQNDKVIWVLHESVYMNNVCDQTFHFNSSGTNDIKYPKTFDDYYDKSKTIACPK